MKNDMEINKNRILDSEIKKANELAPTLMYVNFVTSENKIATSAIVGVKAKLYVCDSEDIMNRLEIDKSKLSPMMIQYLDIKKNYEDAILFFRIGSECFCF